jgi:hypothetical protein
VRYVLIALCGWLLPLLTCADAAAGIELRLVADESRPGDVIELQAELRRAEYAEFVLHVPAHAQLHFVAHTLEPVRYVEGEYVQRELFLLQPMSAGVFELNAITATVEAGGVATEVSLPPVQFEVLSYGAEDTSKEAAELGMNAALRQPVGLVGVTVGAVLFICLLVWLLLRKAKTHPVDVAVVQIGLSDLVAVLEGNAPSLPLGEADVWKRQSVGSESVASLGTLQARASGLAEQLLGRSDLSLSAVLREALETAAYANRIDVAQLLDLLRKEGVR